MRGYCRRGHTAAACTSSCSSANHNTHDDAPDRHQRAKCVPTRASAWHPSPSAPPWAGIFSQSPATKTRKGRPAACRRHRRTALSARQRLSARRHPASRYPCRHLAPSADAGMRKCTASMPVVHTQPHGHTNTATQSHTLNHTHTATRQHGPQTRTTASAHTQPCTHTARHTETHSQRHTDSDSHTSTRIQAHTHRHRQ